MARGILIIFTCLTAAFTAVEARRLRQVEPEHFGFGSSPWWVAAGKRHSPWSESKGHYSPVTNDKSWTYYRMAVRLTVEQSDTFSDGDRLRQAVAYGTVYDLPSNTEIGVWQTHGVVTFDEVSTEDVSFGMIQNVVLELGPELDDSLVIAGVTTQDLYSNGTTQINDPDMAITGGVGKYLGATGEYIIKRHAGTLPNGSPAALEAELKIYVPKLRPF